MGATTPTHTLDPSIKTNKHQKPIQSDKGAKKLPLDTALPSHTMLISEGLAPQEEANLLNFLLRNKDVFTWSSFDLSRVSRSIIEHILHIKPSVRPKKQQLCKMSYEKTKAAKAEV